MPVRIPQSSCFRPIRWLPVLLVCMLAPFAAQARETLTWLLRDLPPSTIVAGPLQGQGVIDRLMPLLMARMPDYDHVLIHVNRARSMQMLIEHPSSCDPTLLWTAERASYIAFSIPVYMLVSSGLIVRKSELPRFAPYLDEGQVDLRALLNTSGLKVGVVARRSYGTVTDQILADSPASALSRHYADEAVGSLLQMERLGRLQALLGFRTEARYQALQQGLDFEQLTFLPIKGNPPYQYAHIGCSDTPQGRKAIEIINREMRTLRETSLMEFYAQWLEPAQRTAYLRDAKAFFEGH